MPRPIDLPSLINSTTYPPVPSLEDLEDLRASLVQRSGATQDRLLSLDRATADKLREARKDKKRKEREQTNAWNAHLEQEATAQAKAKAAGVREKERDKERERDRDREGEDGLKVKRERTGMS
jgi:transcriptional adapter 3